MGTIEQASQRLQQLKQAGVELPWSATAPAAGAASEQPAALAGALRDVGARPAPLAEPRHTVELPLQQLGTEGFMVPGTVRTRLVDEFRAVKRPLLGNAVGAKGRERVDRGNLIMMTSSLPGEGKSFVALNLAISLAMEMDYRVLLVDADPTRRVSSQRLGAAQRSGLLDLLTQPTLALEEVELATNIDKLSFLPAGTPNPLATEVLGSREMHALLDRLATYPEQRIVVFDAPPMLHAAEARALAPQMGQVVLVVQAGSTPRGSVQHALSLLQECPLVMTLLNQSRTPAASSPYGYYAY
jgi:exopolysaccharide/PEP-CTERM locus tyrosine autokinase